MTLISSRINWWKTVSIVTIFRRIPLRLTCRTLAATCTLRTRNRTKPKPLSILVQVSALLMSFPREDAFLMRLEHGDWFNAPWGLTLAPTDFGTFSHKVIVGQFGSGEILAFDAITGRFEGKLKDQNDKSSASMDFGPWRSGTE